MIWWDQSDTTSFCEGRKGGVKKRKMKSFIFKSEIPRIWRFLWRKKRFNTSSNNEVNMLKGKLRENIKMRKKMENYIIISYNESWVKRRTEIKKRELKNI
jgi:hypothetical protein